MNAASSAVKASQKELVAGEGALQLVSGANSNELVFAVVGHVGSGTSEVAEALKSSLEKEDFPGGAYEAHVVKASDLIKTWMKANGGAEGAPGSIEGAFILQDAGDELRKTSQDNSEIAKKLVAEIRSIRAKSKREELVDQKPVEPDGSRRAYILDSLRHPDEVKLLRAVYQDAFVLLGVVCDANTRKLRLAAKCKDAGAEKVSAFMERDSDGHLPHGQKVADTFFMSDFFVENTADRSTFVGKVPKPNPLWTVADDLQRLVEMVTHEKIVRPTMSETAMYHAHGARMRSACLSRQVGAALVDASGEVIATGCNEAPRAGGGVYNGEGQDFRCAFHHGYCSSVREQNRIIDDIANLFPELKGLDKKDIQMRLRKSPIGGLLEFSRAVHAEMDALMAASRKGISTVGTKLYVTTYPCHYCARHIVAAGVDEVQYIEPYPKSLAIGLHDDAISVQLGTLAPSVNKVRVAAGEKSDPEAKVLFRPFTGVSPRLYRRVFLKEQSLKDKNTGDLMIGLPDWGGSLAIKKLSYVDLETKLAHGA
jgi:deoxycytidylate deaminase